MIRFIDRFESQLLAATPPRQQRRRVRRSSTVAVLVVLGVAAPTIAAVQPWKPLLGDDQRGTPARSADAPPPDQLKGLGAFRRPQTAEDRGPLAERALRLTDTNVDGARTDSVRTLSSDVTSAVLVSVMRFNLHAERFLAPDAPAALKKAFGVKRDGICLFVPDPAGDGGGSGCMTWREVREGVVPSRIGPIYYGLVPDGVSRVAIRTDSGQLQAPVTENFFAVHADRAHEAGPVASALGVDWIDASGRVINSVTAPTASTASSP